MLKLLTHHHHYYMLYTLNSAQYIAITPAADSGLSWEYLLIEVVYLLPFPEVSTSEECTDWRSQKYFTFQLNKNEQVMS